MPVASNPLLVLLRKKSFAEAYKAARRDPALINTPDGDDGDTPFQWACRFGDKATMLALLELGADVTKRDTEGLVPLELVADGSSNASAAHVADRTAMAAALLKAKSPLGDNVLANACSLGVGKARDLVKLLIAAKAKGDFVGDGGTILHLACDYDLPEAFDYGLSLGVDVNATTSLAAYDGGTTALHLAVKKRRTAMIERLVAAGARPDVVNKRKESPLSLATVALRAILEGKGAPAKKTPVRAAPKKGMAEILAQLWKAPRDVGLLSVYADALIEQGEASRGEYIRLALLEKPTAAQTKRRAQLLAKDRGRWLGEARRLVSEWVDSETTPGFVSSATVSIEKALAHFDELAALGPELTLRFTPIKTRILTKKLAELPLGKKLYGLHFYNTVGTYRMNRDWLDDTSMAILGPAIVGLRSLTLAPALQAREGEGFTAASFESLEPAAASLEALTLDFSESTPTDALLEALSPKRFPSLERLSIVGLEPRQQKRVKSAWAKAGPKLAFA